MSRQGPDWSLSRLHPCAQLVALHGPKKWSLIAHSLPNKGSKQCRRRWQNYLNNTDAKSGGWTADEVRPATRWVRAARHGQLGPWLAVGRLTRAHTGARTHLLRLRCIHGRRS